MENTEPNTNKVAIGAKVDPAIFAALSHFAVEEDRTLSNTIERLLKTHPRIQPILEAESASVAAPAA